MSNPGLTDEVVSEGHDFIQHAEEEEARVHPDTSPSTQPKKSAGLGGSNTSGPTGRKSSIIEKAKEALHIKK